MNACPDREEKHGAYVIFINAYDWQDSLFRKRGCSECCAPEDFPAEGHSTYELEKRF